MNCCIIAYTNYEIDYRVRRYAEVLSKSGNRVDVISLKGDNSGNKTVFSGINVYAIQRRSFNEKSPYNYFTNILKFMVKSTFLLSSLHFRYNYKLIHVHNVPDFLVFSTVVPKLLGERVILDIHDILPEFYCQKFGKRFDTFIVKMLLLAEKLSVRFSDHVIVANDLWRKKIIDRNNMLPQKCTTYLNYPNLKFFRRFSFVRKSKECKIIYAGTLSHLHGVDIAIKALAIVKREVPKVKLDIYSAVSPIKNKSNLDELIKELNLKDNVEFHKPLRIEELALRYRDFNIGIVTKRAGIFSSEAFSTKIFDYMAAGIPIVASKTKIDEYYFDDSMIMFFKPDDHEDMARCILELYKNPKKGEFLVNNAMRFVDRNNWEDKKQTYLDLVDSLVNKK